MSFKDQLAALIDLKSIVTLGLVFASIYGFVKLTVPNEVFFVLVTAVITYYFTRVKDQPATTTTTTTSETKTVSPPVPTIIVDGDDTKTWLAK